ELGRGERLAGHGLHGIPIKRFDATDLDKHLRPLSESWPVLAMSLVTSRDHWTMVSSPQQPTPRRIQCPVTWSNERFLMARSSRSTPTARQPAARWWRT